MIQVPVAACLSKSRRRAVEMGEFLRLWGDLAVMSKHLPIGILQHRFAVEDPAATRALRDTIAHFYMLELEASEYRSAYHQFCDWLYGWSVNDGTETHVDGEFATRVPREIIMSAEREKFDAQRLMKTFETLTSLSLRHLKKSYADIEVCRSIS